MKTSVRIVDGDRIFVVHPSTNILPQALQVGSPSVREVTESRTDDDGERDSTELFGSRAVSLNIVVLKDDVECERVLDQLKMFLHPRSRPYLYVVDDGWAQERRIKLRVDQWSEPYEGYVASQAREVQLQWKAPDGVWEAADAAEETIAADIATDAGGMSFPTSFPMSFAPTMAVGSTTVTNFGVIPSHFVVRLYGPCTAPTLVNETTGEQLAFTSSLSLAAGQYVEVDTREQTATAQSDASVTRLNYVDFATTSWWQLQPGDNAIRYAPKDADAGAQAVITYRPAWL